MSVLSSFRFLSLVVLLAVLPATGSAELRYPFEVADDMTSTLHIETQSKQPVQPMVLGLNSNWPERLTRSRITFN